MKKKILTAVLTAALALSLCACADEYYEYDESGENYSEGYSYDENDGSYYDSSYDQSDDYQSYYSQDTTDYPFDTSIGSAKELDGKIAIISIFVNDNTTSWDFENSADQEMEGLIYNDLKIATEYLENAVKDYGRDMDMIYDWAEIPELAYTLDVNADYQTIDDSYGDLDYSFWDAISKNVPTEDILNKTGATQAVYMLYFNTPASNTKTSCTRNHYEGMPYPYEMCYMFMNCSGDKEPPACFAHEILHTFGAVDLYMASEFDGITQEYVDYAESSKLNDIMRICEDPKNGAYLYDTIKNEITDITAYYTGLTDSSETVDEWGFPRSQH